MSDPYGQVPYPELVHPQTHPDRLAVVGTLLGMTPASADACRVLELGCGPGLNLIAMAEALPEGTFHGIDYSPPHVARACNRIGQLGLTNVRVSQGDVRTFDTRTEPYDVIIAHGVYSWVERDVRDALMRIIRNTLAPHGIALVSYNTYPGWFMLRTVREMMLFHGRAEPDPGAKVAKGGEILSFLLEHLDPTSNLYAANLAGYRVALEDRFGLTEAERIGSILHDDLAAVNEPVFFHEFAGHAAEWGLQYVAEADLRGSTPTGLSADVVRRLRQLAPDVISLEQYLDFLVNRTFRQTLVCHQDVPLRRTLTARGQVLAGFHISSDAMPPEDPQAALAGGGLRISTADGNELLTDDPLSKAALVTLASASPRTLTWDGLVSEALALANEPGADAPAALDVLAGTLLRAFTVSRSLVSLWTLPDRFTTEVSTRPRVGALVRLLSAEGQRRLPNWRHELVLVEASDCAVIAHMDGRHDLKALVALYHPAPDGRSFDDLLAFLARSALLDARH